MNNFLLEYAPPKSQPSQKVELRPAFVLRRSGRIIVPATATFMPETESPYKSQTRICGLCLAP